MILGRGKDQPVPSQNLVGPVLREDLITPVRIHFQRGSRTMHRLSVDFYANALIGPGEGRLRPCRRAAEDQDYGAKDENFS